jgi:hypothetical protein
MLRTNRTPSSKYIFYALHVYFSDLFLKKDISAFISICKEKPCFHLILDFSTTSPRRHSIGKEEVMNL